MSSIRFSRIMQLKSYMKILIDKGIETDDDGNFLINVGYIRVSTDRQADLGYGLEMQENDVLNYAEKNDYTNLLLFTDDGYTGTNMDRPALQGIIDMISEYNAGTSRVRIASMIIPRIDRLGRTLLGTLQFIQDYIVASKDSKGSTVNKNRDDITFISVAENYCRIEKNNPQGKFLLMLFASLAEFDRDLIVQKMKRGMVSRVASGKWMGGGREPFGYKYSKEKGKLIVIPDKAEKVREVFRLYTEEHMSPQRIAERLGFKGERIVAQMLERKTYAGYIVYKGEEYKGEQEPIISLEQWQDAQDESEKRSVVRGDPAYLLTGLLYCGECGAKMRYQKWNKKTGECRLVCYSTQKGKDYLVKDKNCAMPKFWQSEVEKAVLDELFKLKYLNNDRNTKSGNAIDPIETLNRELVKEKRKLAKLYDLVGEDSEEDDVLSEKIATVKKTIKSIGEQIKSEQEQVKIKRRLEKANRIIRTLADTWDGMSQKERQSVCRELIDKVVIFKDGTIDVHLRLKRYIQKDLS